MNLLDQDIAEIAGISAMNAEMWHDLDGLPTYHDWISVRRAFGAAIRDSFSKWVAPSQSHFREQLAFALGRFDEGAGLVRYIEQYSGMESTEGLKVLDIGAGNGGVAFALANCRKYTVAALDVIPNVDLVTLRCSLGIPISPIVAIGQRIPLASGSTDVVFLLDTIEHVPNASRLGSEVMRILRPGGLCMVTTPPRLRYLLRPDPHFGVRGLLTLPNGLQRFMVNTVFRRRVSTWKGEEVPAYDVEHIFWHMREVGRLFPGAEVGALYNRMLSPGSIWSRAGWSYRLREFFWDRILLRKVA